MDLSNLDKKYFIDSTVYNCPFCKRNNVPYKITNAIPFNWTDKKICYCYFIECKSCNNISLHWSWKDLRETNFQGNHYNEFSNKYNLDEELFYSRPTSYFTLDDRIPEIIRNLIFESEQSKQANFLMGASACLRKAIYELLNYSKAIVVNKNTGHTNYSESIKSLKNKYHTVSPELFDAILNIQGLTSDSLHEDSWESWNSPRLRFLIELVKAILDEIFVVPDERKKRLCILDQLKNTFEIDKKVINKKQ